MGSGISVGAIYHSIGFVVAGGSIYESDVQWLAEVDGFGLLLLVISLDRFR